MGSAFDNLLLRLEEEKREKRRLVEKYSCDLCDCDDAEYSLYEDDKITHMCLDCVRMENDERLRKMLE